MKSMRSVASLLLLSALPVASLALLVTTSSNANDLLNAALGTLPSGVTVTGVSYSGAGIASGIYNNLTWSPLSSLSSGMLLTSGDALAPLVERFGPSIVGETSIGTPALDVPEVVRIACREAGVETLEDTGICTYASREHFSHRRDGLTGRQALVAVLT